MITHVTTPAARVDHCFVIITYHRRPPAAVPRPRSSIHQIGKERQLIHLIHRDLIHELILIAVGIAAAGQRRLVVVVEH